MLKYLSFCQVSQENTEHWNEDLFLINKDMALLLLFFYIQFSSSYENCLNSCPFEPIQDPAETDCACFCRGNNDVIWCESEQLESVPEFNQVVLFLQFEQI